MSERACLNCGETPSSIKRHGIVLCGIMSGGEQPELSEEFPTHRWADWSDAALARVGIKPEAFERHRRTPLRHLEWVGCEDTVRGHNPATEDDVPDWADRVGQCTFCGHDAASPGGAA